jgi:hypothetical protein
MQTYLQSHCPETVAVYRVSAYRQVYTLQYHSRLVMNSVKSLWRQKAYHYDKEQKLVKNFLLKFETKLINFGILLLDYAKE